MASHLRVMWEYLLPDCFFNLLEISESTISSVEENRLVLTCTGKICVYLVNSRGSHMSTQGTHTTDSSKELCVSLTHTT